MTRPENELFRGINNEVSKGIQRNEEISYPENPEGGEDQIVFQSETSNSPEILPKSELLHQPEVQIEKEGRPGQSIINKRKPIRALLLKKIIEKWRKREITEEEKKKSLIALKQLWPVHGAICAAGFAAIVFRFGPHILRARSLTSLLWRMRSDPLLTAYILTPGVAKLVTVFAFERRYDDVKFSLLSKGISLWPFIGGGLAMPVEVAYTLGEGPWLVNELKERYIKTPLTQMRSAAQKVRGVFKR